MENLLNNPLVKEVFELLDPYEVFIVGGAVRDTLLGKEISDIDFATNALPDDVERVAQEKGYKTIATGKHFGTIVVMVQGEGVEITTYRKGEQYEDGSRHPEVQYGNIVEEDLQRRDFTINALALNNKKLADPFQGKKDLAEGVIRTPQHSNKTFRDDPLRMIRAIRFVSKYGFKIDPQTLKGIENNAHRVLYLSKERIKMEMDKLLLGEYVDEALQLLMDTKVMNYILPEVTVLKDIKQDETYHHKDVWKHTKLVVKNTPADILLRWSALLHDIAKPYTKTIVKGHVHFYNHEDLGKDLAESILSRLKFSGYETYTILFIIKNHMRPNLYNPKWSERAIRRFKVDMGDNLFKVIEFSKADITSQHPDRIKKALDNLADLKSRCEKEPDPIVTCPISGHAIMGVFPNVPGITVGMLKDKIVEQLINDPNYFKEESDYFKFCKRILDEV